MFSQNWRTLLLTVFGLVPTAGFAGTFVGVDGKIATGINIPYAIVHPIGYSGTGGQLIIDICILDTFSEADKLVGPLQAAIRTWNSLTPTAGSCENCILWEETPPAQGAIDAESTLLHELGHCAMGLDHPNMDRNGPPAFENTSYTKSIGVVSITDSNGIPGDFDDIHSIATNVDDVSWFRTADNHPVIIDSTVIDIATFSRSVAGDIPLGHNYAANANRAVAQALGFPDSQSVMYSRGAALMKSRELVADDVNMVKMAMVGADFTALTADDYTVSLRYHATCNDDTEIRVEFFPIPNGSVVGSCPVEIVTSFPQGVLKFHWTVIPQPGAPTLVVSLNNALDPQWTWDYGDLIYLSDFENGDLSDWSTTVP